MSTAILATGLSAAGARTRGPFGRLAALAGRVLSGGPAADRGSGVPSSCVSATVPSYQNSGGAQAGGPHAGLGAVRAGLRREGIRAAGTGTGGGGEGGGGRGRGGGGGGGGAGRPPGGGGGPGAGRRDASPP